MRKIATSLGIVALCLFASGCALDKEYVKADKATFDAVAPEYLKYVSEDAKLTQDQRDRRYRTVSTWRLRIDKVEGN